MKNGDFFSKTSFLVGCTVFGFSVWMYNWIGDYFRCRRERFREFVPKKGWEGFFTYFLNNAMVALILKSGIFLMGIPTLTTLFLNGLWVGAAVAGNLLGGMSPAKIAVGILTHGVFELPALMLAGAIGLIGFRKRRNILCKQFVTVSLLLIIAAFVEGFITPMMMKQIS